jgi:hypothetical protein
LTHEHSDFAFLAVAHELKVSNATLLPLAVVKSVKFCSLLEDALEAFLAGLHWCNTRDINLKKSKVSHANSFAILL